jgi:hypothetical protein
MQPLLKLSIKQFPGLRSADRKTQKQIGLEALKRAELDPSLQMEFEREVKLVSEP